MPDAEVARIRETIASPHFRQGRYGEGILAGTNAIARALAEGGSPTNRVRGREDARRVPSWALLAATVGAWLALPVALWLLIPVARTARLWSAIAFTTCSGALLLQASGLTPLGRTFIAALTVAVAGWLYHRRARLFKRPIFERRAGWGDGFDTYGGGETWGGGGFAGGNFGGFGGGATGGGGAGGDD